MSLQEKQLALLVKRQAEFKAAALKAKKSGQIEQAKEYLRQAKGFDSLIEASKGGLPVNFKTLPVLPTKGIFTLPHFRACAQLIMFFLEKSRQKVIPISLVYSKTQRSPAPFFPIPAMYFIFFHQ